MREEIIELEDYKNLISNKEKLDSNSISIDSLPLEEIEDVNNLYKKELEGLAKRIDFLKKENQGLREEIEHK